MTDDKRKTISSEEVFKRLADAEQAESARELADYVTQAELMDDSQVPTDERFLAFAKEYDRRKAEKAKKIGFGRVAKVAVLCIAVVGVLGAVTLRTTEAFKFKGFEMIFGSNGEGTSTIETLPENESLKDWDGHYYPEYLPEGVEFDSKNDNEMGRETAFVHKDGKYQLYLFEYKSEGLSMTHNTENQTVTEVKIGEAKGWLFRSNKANSCYVVWSAGDKVLNLSAYDYGDTDELLKIAESVKYIE